MQFIKERKKFYLLSSLLIVISVIAFLWLPKNLGIDMTGGIQIEYSVSEIPSQEVISTIKEDFLKNYQHQSKSVLSDVNIYLINERSLRADIGLLPENDVTLSDARAMDIRSVLPTYFSREQIEVSEAQFVSVGQSFGKFVLDRAYWTLAMCLIGIALYLMFAFRQSIQETSSFVFGNVTLVTLLHDIVIASGIYVILSFFFPVLKIDTFFVTAILTILGYSINDTIVILDRIRSEYRDLRASDHRNDAKIFEDSVQVSLWRSILTSSTLTLVLIAMLFFGPSVLYGFITLMLLGTIVGTYSSIMIAAPLIYDIKKRSDR